MSAPGTGKREGTGGGWPWGGFPQVVGWKCSPHLERTPRSVAVAASEVPPQPTPCRTHCLAFDSFCNLYLEQLLPTPKVILSAAFSNSQVLTVATSPSATGPMVPSQEWDPNGRLLRILERAWLPLPDHGLLSFSPSGAPAGRTGLGQPASCSHPSECPGLPL